jgi:hypothetical protein
MKRMKCCQHLLEHEQPCPLLKAIDRFRAEKAELRAKLAEAATKAAIHQGADLVRAIARAEAAEAKLAEAEAAYNGAILRWQAECERGIELEQQVDELRGVT